MRSRMGGLMSSLPSPFPMPASTDLRLVDGFSSPGVSSNQGHRVLVVEGGCDRLSLPKCPGVFMGGVLRPWIFLYR